PIKRNGGPQMRVGAVDEELLVAWCRIGDRLRMTSSAEFTGYETSYKEHDLRLIRKLAGDLLPDAAEYDSGTYRACNRPMTPDGPPILGPRSEEHTPDPTLFRCVAEELLVAWCRIGDRLRMTSSAEFTGYETSYKEHDLRLIRKLAGDLLPDAAEYDSGTYRACNRPMTPDGPPILGP